MSLRKLYYFLPPGLRRLARRLVYFPIDFYDGLPGKRLQLVPPRGRIFTGQGDFAAIGDKFLRDFIETCQLKPHHKVLDVGCGIGRIARPLTTFLDKSGAYDGFDIVSEGINWCKRHYLDYPNFSFTRVLIDNDLYQLGTGVNASSFSFPCKDNQYDLVVLISVFTHMQAAEVQQYLYEINRVIKPGGKCYATFFLLTSSSKDRQNQHPKPFFKYREDGVYLHDKRVKNANVGYDFEQIQGMAQKASLSVEQFHEGWWSGLSEKSCKDFQDVLVLSPLI